MRELSQIVKKFEKIEIPRYLENKINEIAVFHLGLKDIGKLRDKYDAQLYLDILTTDIKAEFAFEKFLGKEFDWNSRKSKNYQRLEYLINDNPIQIVPFTSNRKPFIKCIKNSFFVYVKPEKYVYLGGLILKENLKKIIKGKNISEIENIFIEVSDINIDKLIYFKNYNDLQEYILQNG